VVTNLVKQGTLTNTTALGPSCGRFLHCFYLPFWFLNRALSLPLPIYLLHLPSSASFSTPSLYLSNYLSIELFPISIYISTSPPHVFLPLNPPLSLSPSLFFHPPSLRKDDNIKASPLDMLPVVQTPQTLWGILVFCVALWGYFLLCCFVNFCYPPMTYLYVQCPAGSWCGTRYLGHPSSILVVFCVALWHYCLLFFVTFLHLHGLH
jgi:hypothetical protein